jgi:hypothetical protein
VAARLTAALSVLAIVAACARSPAQIDGGQDARATPQQSLSASLLTTIDALRVHLGPTYPLVPVTRAYVPSEPESLQTAPRSVFQVDLGDPDAGYVVVYELSDTAAAAARGSELARYIGSGFGQTNYPPDAQFALSQYANALVLAWWSPQHSSNLQLERAAFERISDFGQPIPIVK